MSQNKLTRASLLLALTLLFQSLRFFIPLPPILSTFAIGSLVNMCLLIAVESIGMAPSLMIALVAPIAAYLQGLLFMPLFILPVAIGNMLYIAIYHLIHGKIQARMIAVVLSAITKAAFLYVAFLFLLSAINIPQQIAAGLLFVMSWPQILTGILGGFFAYLVMKRLN